jgi:TonB-dependent starch-binding outer membrane protein SusC
MKTNYLLKLKPYKKTGILFLSVLFTMLFRSIQAQNITVSGSINTSTNRQVIAGASVQIKGTTTGTVSDANGNFKISAPKTATLIIRSVGFASKEVLVNNKTIIEVLLDEDIKSIDEVVVVGYGTQKKSDVTGSIVSIKSETIEKLSFTDAAQAIQGLAPGVSVESQSGAPGAPINVKIRGTGSLGNTNPLYVVDGLPVNDLSNVSSSDIASIEILKDASASAIYGTRASNGVVLVTTKRGKEGQTLISFNARYGFQNLNKKMPLTDINGRLYAQSLSDRFNRGNQIGLFTPMDIAVQNAILNNTDWQNELFDKSAPQQEYSLNMSKGTAIGSYSVNANYTSRAGIMKGSDYDRYTIRFNSDFKKSIFTFTQNFQVYRSFQNLKFGWQNAFSTVRLAPWVPAYGDASNPTGINESKYPNPLQLAESTENNTTQNGIQGAFAINAQVTPWLAIRGKVGSRFESSAFRNYSGPYNFGQASKVTSELTETNTNSEYLLGEIFAEFKKTYGKHDLNFLIGYTSESWKTKFQRLYGEGFLNKDIREMSAATKNRDASGSLTKTTILSKIARISYGYNDKYNVQASFRKKIRKFLFYFRCLEDSE